MYIFKYNYKYFNIYLLAMSLGCLVILLTKTLYPDMILLYIMGYIIIIVVLFDFVIKVSTKFIIDDNRLIKKSLVKEQSIQLSDINRIYMTPSTRSVFVCFTDGCENIYVQEAVKNYKDLIKIILNIVLKNNKLIVDKDINIILEEK